MSFRSHDDGAGAILTMVLGYRTRRLAADDDIPVFHRCCIIPDGDGARSKLITGPLLT